MTIGHAAGLGILSLGIAYQQEDFKLNSDVPAERIAYEASLAGASFACANAFTSALRISLFTFAASSALLAATAVATLFVAAKVFNALKVKESNGANLSLLTIIVVNSFLSSAVLAKQFGLVSSFGKFFNIGFTTVVGAMGLQFTVLVIMRIYHLLFGASSSVVSRSAPHQNGTATSV